MTWSMKRRWSWKPLTAPQIMPSASPRCTIMAPIRVKRRRISTRAISLVMPLRHIMSQ
ncbi:Uncharacterised protein [Bordetella pertussis]|nr:Uncharacterised protein [Bordetella pertussis]CPJ03373.1 Uncharacterised protein [Bordetella pertussis]CPN86416.1 Uncharacterised protein [Bordetella pertussis]